MTRSVKSFLIVPQLRWWKSALVGGAVALAPLLGLADDRDKHDKSGGKQQSVPAMKSQNPQGGAGAATGQSTKSVGASDRKSTVPIEILPLELRGKTAGGDSKKLNLQTEPPAKRFDSMVKKTIKAEDLKITNPRSEQINNFSQLHKSGKLDGLTKSAVAQKIELSKQFELHHKGDLTMKLDLAKKVASHGGWSACRWSGLIGPGFGFGCSPIVYCGPGYFPGHCLYPRWCGWVDFCWGFHCEPVCDPRPWLCRPCFYDPCGSWLCWDYPVWYGLPEVVCGTWIDVAPVVVDAGLDLQLLAVRFVDPGHAEQNVGPRYRVWFRNNSPVAIQQPFDVLLMAANSRDAFPNLPQAGVRVASMQPGQIQAVDIRLPSEASVMGQDSSGQPIPFSTLHVLVDSAREVPEVFKANNGAVIARADVLPVDPVIFGSDSKAPTTGAELSIAGEGFGPEPGQVLVHVGGLELQAEIEGWYDLGVRIKLPALALASPTEAQLIIVRGDTAASNPLEIQMTVPLASR